MGIKKLSTFFVSVYLIICAFLIFNSGLFSNQPDTEKGILSLAAEVNLPQTNNVPQMSAAADMPVDVSQITATSAEQEVFTLGSVLNAKDGNPYVIELKLTTKGAAVMSARFRDYDDRNPKNPQPLEFLSPVENTNTLASKKLFLYDLEKAFPLDRLNWQSTGTIKNADGSESISFCATILNNSNDFIKLTKTYTLEPETYLMNCDIAIANLSDTGARISFEMLGGVGISKEDTRMDSRTITAGFLDAQGKVETIKKSVKNLAEAPGGKILLSHKNIDCKFLWAATSNKYFASIIRPVPTDTNNLPAEWISNKSALYFDPDILVKNDENIGVSIQTQAVSVLPKQEFAYKFQVYLGPKDRTRFEGVALYKSLGFIKVIDFRACCGNVFSSLSLFILGVMSRLYDFIPNYGVIIIIFVVVVRILLHPITKKSQISMMKMSKLGPKAEEIKEKYANNKTEMNKQMMALYREHGASPILGCLPMLFQMPIWIALYSAIYAGIEFRGAALLPFWITDLSSPDALFALPGATENLPIIGTFIGTSFNLLPILLAAAMFAQQKMMPTSTTSSSNPQVAQQQKMMMWMMPVMLFIFLYRAPSGLNLYIMSSTTAAVFEQYVIRKHIREKESAEEAFLVPTTSKAGGKLKKKKPKPPIRFS
ncbi:MAG: membrane protein insertase YidC [Sedimentisphaerales bacterium]|nr:membrane protein insertase YidC [Sedimentisphaerales bacterium]